MNSVEGLVAVLYTSCARFLQSNQFVERHWLTHRSRELTPTLYLELYASDSCRIILAAASSAANKLGYTQQEDKQLKPLFLGATFLPHYQLDIAKYVLRLPPIHFCHAGGYAEQYQV